jgi:hypothetical protein
MFRPENHEPEDSAKWLIDEISKEASLQDSPLSDWDLGLLSRTFLEIPDNERHLAVASINLAVELVRGAIVRAKQSGADSIVVREGLVLPQVWEDHYEAIYETEFPWLISLVMQNAFMGNPFADETQPWMSD